MVNPKFRCILQGFAKRSGKNQTVHPNSFSKYIEKIFFRKILKKSKFDVYCKASLIVAKQNRFFNKIQPISVGV